ncbi:MAG: hypothetical protein JXR03_14015 [Cyclobacteriaceae bacterium]
MKQLSILLILLSNVCSAQEVKIDSCGLNNSSVLNEFEIQYFKQELSKQLERHGFNLINKKIAFAQGNFGKGIITKQEYFNQWGRSYFNNNSHVVNQLIVLNAEERVNSGGYDAIIISWSKILVAGKHRRKLIENLNKVKIQ